MKDGLQPRRLISLFFIAAIAVVFILQFGPGGHGFGTSKKTAPGSAAVVNGQEIPLQEFQRAYANQLQFFRARGQPIPESLAKQIGIPQQVLDQLVNTELLAQAAEKRGVVPSDDELRELIHQNPDFQKDGEFSFDTYTQVLRDYYRKTAPQYETELRRRLAAVKLLELVESGATVSEDEVRARFQKEGNQAKLVFARFLPSMYTDKVPAPKPAELTAWQAAHQKEIADYYEANKFVYQQAERVHARQILVKLAPEATPAQKAEAMQKAQALQKELAGGKDFAQLAQAKSEDAGSKARGGDLGWVEKGTLPQPLGEAVFALKAGEVSQPVESQFGVHLVKVEEKQAAKSKSLQDATAEIARTLYTKEQALALAKKAAEAALAQVKAGKSLSALFPPEKEGQPALLRFETETRPEAVETDAFTAAGDTVPHLGPAPELVRAAFQKDAAGPLDSVFNLGEGYVVAQVTERKKPSDESFAQAKAELQQQARQAKQIELRSAFLEALKKEGKVQTNPDALAGVTDAS
ncbi:peptidylprolyl isomerase [Aggregicoccus sp. 17bor-14]|uniref:peptidylprolyl isomerase n=1 Tax=Myxococcaceae TaxID=31 RepID=UPI00129D1484|nr:MULTISPECIES: peptidylprolyl isomerase [Myxococcaceae]MBF5041448.1 SurA N-terminal domain-containing protein [Simulacricoccus sp. 17bor-14]MRI87232.1 peptidylprolyl isomerase [Aggregicoccus sp. 17bor-14]